MKLNYKKMIEDVNKITQTDFMFEIGCKSMPNSSPFTRAEARKMCEELMKIYSIAHCVTCTGCSSKYKIK